MSRQNEICLRCKNRTKLTEGFITVKNACDIADYPFLNEYDEDDEGAVPYLADRIGYRRGEEVCFVNSMSVYCGKEVLFAGQFNYFEGDNISTHGYLWQPWMLKKVTVTRITLTCKVGKDVCAEAFTLSGDISRLKSIYGKITKCNSFTEEVEL